MRVLVVHAHPDPDSFSAELVERVVQALTPRHQVEVIDLYAEGFEPALSAEAHARHLDPPHTKPEIARHVSRLQAADALVLVYPTWWGGPPAMLKGWFDRVWTSGVAFELVDRGTGLRGRLRNIRRLVVVSTHGSPRRLNALGGEPGKRLVLRGLRSMCGVRCRTRWLALYGLDRADHAGRARFADRVSGHFSRW